MIRNLGLTMFLVLMNGFFVAAEFALVKVRQSQIELRIRAGSKLANLSKNMISHLNIYLSATQLGVTLASLGLGWIGEPVVAEIILDVMSALGIGISAKLAHNIALPVAFIAITMLHIIFGELVPKSLAIQRSEQVAIIFSWPLRLFYLIFRPFIWVLNISSNFILRLLGFGPATEAEGVHSSDELRYIIEEGSKKGVIEQSEHTLIENIFEFTDTPIKQIMVPRGKIVAVEISMTAQEILDTFIEEGYSRLPIYSGSIDNITGIIYAKDLLSLMNNRQLIIIHDLIRNPTFVQEDEKINTLLREMQRQKIHMAIVIDEFGGTAGLVTMEDIIEEIVGEIQDEYDEETPLIEKVKDDEFVVHASATINDANDYLPEPLPESDDYETVGGLIISHLGRIPEANERIRLDNYQWQIMKRSKRSVELVKLKYEKPEDEDGEG